jgi:hypothetical protein
VADRDPFDAYYTPAALADACLSVLPGVFNTVLEPMAGGASFLRAAKERWLPHHLEGCDIDNRGALNLSHPRPIQVHNSRVDDWHPDCVGRTLIATNPAYRNIYQVIAQHRALQDRTGAEVLGLLLRATTIEQLMSGEDPPCAIYVSDLRPVWDGPGGELHRKLKKDGTLGAKVSDNCGSAWCVWLRPARTRRAGPTLLDALPAWRIKGERRA